MNTYKVNIPVTSWKKSVRNSVEMFGAALALIFTVMIILCSLTVTFIVAKLLSFSSGIDREIEARISRIRLMRFSPAFTYIATHRISK